MASKEEEAAEINRLWWNGHSRLRDAFHYEDCLAEHFVNFRNNGLDDETIAMAFSVPVEDVRHDIRVYDEGLTMKKESDRRAAAWVAKNGPSSLLGGYVE